MKISKKYLIIFLVLIAGLVFFNVFPKTSDFLEASVFKAFSPIQIFFSGIGNKTSGFFKLIASIKDLNSENTELKNKNIELESELIKLKETERENLNLRQALNFSENNVLLYEIASVVGKAVQGGENWILINKGLKDGINADSVIVSDNFSLVGKTVEVYDGFSRVILITNIKNAVAALIEGKRSEGLIQKEEGGNKIFMDFIPKEETPEIGEKVLTSGMDNIYPSGILIGKVESVDQSQNQLFTKVIIDPEVDFLKLEKVFIIKNK